MRRLALLLPMVFACKGEGSTDRLSDIVELHVTGRYTCGVDSKRRVFCWGPAYQGKDADGSDRPGSIPVSRPRHIDGIDGVIQLIHHDWGHGVARMPDGRIFAWPRADLRPRKRESKEAPPELWADVDPSTFDAFHAHPTGLSFTGELMWLDTPCEYADAKLRCAEPDYNSQLPFWGEGETMGLPGLVSAMDVGAYPHDASRQTSYCMLFQDGRVDCLQAERKWTLDVGGPVREIVDGDENLGLVLEDGRIAITGWDLTPHLEERVGPVLDLDVESTRACVITQAYEVRCWWGPGDPDATRRADDSEIERPIEGFDRPIQVQARGTGGCVLEASGFVKCWGLNEGGECGIGSVSERVEPPTYVVAPGA